MQDESDRADTDRVHEGYQQRYEKERRASYGLVIFALLAFCFIAVGAFMHHVGFGAASLTNIEPSAGTTTDEETNAQVPAETPNEPGNIMETNTTGTDSMDTRDTNTADTNTMDTNTTAPTNTTP